MKAKKGLKITGFKLERRKDKETGLLRELNVPILVEFRFDNQRVIYPIGFRIDYDKWSVEEQRVKRNNFNKDLISASVINKRIERIKDYLPKIYNDALELEIPITTKYLLEELNIYLNEKEQIQNTKIISEQPKQTVIDYLEMFIDTESIQKNWSIGTKKRIVNFRNWLINYKPKLKFEDLTQDFFNKTISYNSEVMNYTNVTNQKTIKNFRWFLNWATQKGYNTNLEYTKFKNKFKGITTSDYQKNIVFLSWDELQHLNNIDFTNNTRLGQIRDIYCFCCFTSLRYSDVANLKKNNIKTDNNGNHYLEIMTVKTDDKLSIELNKYALAILNKYKNIELKDNRVFPVPSNQKYNEYLKEVAKIAELKSKETVIEFKGNKRIEQTFEKWELITTHTARKTFIINALYLGIQPDIIRSWTGHKDHKTMEQYVKIVNEQKRVSMNKFNDI